MSASTCSASGADLHLWRCQRGLALIREAAGTTRRPHLQDVISFAKYWFVVCFLSLTRHSAALKFHRATTG